MVVTPAAVVLMEERVAVATAWEEMVADVVVACPGAAAQEAVMALTVG